MRNRGAAARALFAVALSIASVAGCGGNLARGRKSASPSICQAAAGTAPAAGTVKYRAKEIVWDEAVDPPRLSINGEPITVHRLSAGKDTRYYAPFVMTYMDCTNLLGLAHAVIDTGVR